MTRLSICLTAFILICSSLLPVSAAAQKVNSVIPADAGIQTSSSETANTIDFSNDTISEPVNVGFWKRQIQDTLKGVEIDSTSSPFRKLWPRVIFHYSVRFISTRFDSTADFIFAKFHSTADFRVATFEGTAGFSRATFDSEAFFLDATFHSTADFSWATFDSAAFFFGVTFHSTADFVMATFEDTADFRRATFEDTADFVLATFDYTAGFTWATFGSWADFRMARFQGKVDVWKTKLPDSLDFRNVTEITSEIDFTYCLPPSKDTKCRIALEGTDISKVKLNMNLFELSFPEDTVQEPTGEADTTYKESLGVIDTIVRKIVDTIIYPTYDQRCSIYEQVLKKLENDGFMDSYEIVDVQYRRFKARHRGGLSWYVADTFQDWWWNYGYSKERVFLWTIGFWLLFSFVNLWVYEKLSNSVYRIRFLDKMPVRRVMLIALQAMTYTSVVFFGLKMNIKDFKDGAASEHPLLFSYLMSIYVIGLVCLGFIVNIIFTR